MRSKALAAAAATAMSCCAMTGAAQAATTTQSGVLPTLPAFQLSYLVKPGATLGPGLIFMDPHQVSATAVTGPEIITTSGKVVWYDPLPGAQSASNFQVQEYQGQPVLTWWQGTSSNPAFGAFAIGIGQGEDVIMNSHYKIIKIIGANGGLEPDSHEFTITGSGDALITAYQDVPDVNLTSVGGSASGTVVNSVVEDIDIATGQVLLNWSALAHVPITDSYALPLLGQSPWDYFHVNSVSLAPNGDLLISARHTWALYEVDPTTGNIVWTLGGKASNFQMGANTQFAWQHDPRFVSANEIELFDDEAGTPFKANGTESRALWLDLDTTNMTATFVKQIVQPANQVETESQGSVQSLANGNVLIGWGEAGSFSEYGADGQMLMEATLPTDGTTVVNGYVVPNSWQTYRVFQEQWTGMPTTKPVVQVTSTGSKLTVRAAWNGATQVAKWRILSGKNRSSLASSHTVAWNGLITDASIKTAGARYLRIAALGSNGKVLARSAIVRVS